MPAESEHTAPSEWCPHPERWHAPDGWATEEEVSDLIYGLVRATQPEFVIETGTYYGHTTLAIGAALAKNGHGHCHSLEIDLGRATAAADVVAGYPVTVQWGDSREYRPYRPVDMLWLDSADIRAEELANFRPYLSRGAVVAVHDTAPHTHDPEWIEELTDGAAAINLRTPRGVLIFQMP